MAVPLRSELLGQVADFERRTLRNFTKGMEDRRRNLSQLARVLPRADQLFAQPRQRFDHAAEKLRQALSQNLVAHARTKDRIAARLSAGPIKANIRLLSERTTAYGRRLNQIESVRIAESRRHIEALGRVLEGLSYRSALDRGFALVRGEDGRIRRRAAQVAGGEGLSLTFADGDVGAVATGTPSKPKPRGKPSGGQGSLF
jgi:exodeoxyribonuclease VII large subunit